MRRLLPAFMLTGLLALLTPTTPAQDTALASRSAPAVETMRVPDAGIQPQATVGADGTTQLISRFRASAAAPMACRRGASSRRSPGRAEDS